MEKEVEKGGRKPGLGLSLERKDISNSNFLAQPLLNEEEAFK